MLLALMLLAAPNRYDGIASMLKSSDWGGATVAIAVANESGTIEFSQNLDRPMMPASNEKLVSCALAMHRLGPNYRPFTDFFKVGDKLVVNAPGDPSITWKDLSEVRSRLGTKFSKIELKQAYSPYLHRDWLREDIPNRYAAPIAAFAADHGSFEIRTVNGQVAELPPEYGISIGRKVSAEPLHAQYLYDRATVNLTGAISPENKLIEAFALKSPDLVAARLFASAVSPAASIPLRASDATIVGPRLTDLCAHCLSESDNYYAENIFLMATSPHGSRPWDDAQKIAEEFLRAEIRWPGRNPVIRDGSGLSRKSQLTAHGILSLLEWVDRQSWGPQFYGGMAAPGIGTLKKRLIGHALQAKTGTAHDIACLSGVLTTQKTHQKKYFSILVNGGHRNSQYLHGLIDKLVVQLDPTEPNADELDPNRPKPHEPSLPHASALAPAGHRSH